MPATQRTNVWQASAVWLHVQAFSLPPLPTHARAHTRTAGRHVCACVPARERAGEQATAPQGCAHAPTRPGAPVARGAPARSRAALGPWQRSRAPPAAWAAARAALRSKGPHPGPTTAGSRGAACGRRCVCGGGGGGGWGGRAGARVVHRDGGGWVGGWGEKGRRAAAAAAAAGGQVHAVGLRLSPAPWPWPPTQPHSPAARPRRV